MTLASIKESDNATYGHGLPELAGTGQSAWLVGVYIDPTIWKNSWAVRSQGEDAQTQTHILILNMYSKSEEERQTLCNIT